jgi:hypothetical protein
MFIFKNPGSRHNTEQYANNRAELSHQPTRVRERGMSLTCQYPSLCSGEKPKTGALEYKQGHQVIANAEQTYLWYHLVLTEGPFEPCHLNAKPTSPKEAV